MKYTKKELAIDRIKKQPFFDGSILFMVLNTLIGMRLSK